MNRRQVFRNAVLPAAPATAEVAYLFDAVLVTH